MQGLERGAWLDGQLVERQVIRRQRERLAQFGPPGWQRLAWTRIDQVERNAWEDRPRRFPKPRSPARAECCRPSNCSAAGSRLWTPIETRLTPASRNAANRPASTLVGLASRVISISSAGWKRRRASSISVGDRVRLPSGWACRRRRRSSSACGGRGARPPRPARARSAARKRACGMRSRTWELKSQYGHLARQNGQWI